MTLFNALIRTHHITSRKKLAKLRVAFTAPEHTGLTLAVLHIGASPGMIYIEGRDREAINSWIAVVQGLQYKYFTIISKTDVAIDRCTVGVNIEKRLEAAPESLDMGFREVNSISNFGKFMKARGLKEWWLQAMGWDKKMNGQ